MSKDAKVDEAAKGKRPLNRWDCPGILSVGGKVIWDGEAEYLGFPPKQTIEVADNLKDIDYPARDAEAKPRRPKRP